MEFKDVLVTLYATIFGVYITLHLTVYEGFSWFTALKMGYDEVVQDAMQAYTLFMLYFLFNILCLFMMYIYFNKRPHSDLKYPLSLSFLLIPILSNGAIGRHIVKHPNYELFPSWLSILYLLVLLVIFIILLVPYLKWTHES